MYDISFAFFYSKVHKFKVEEPTTRPLEMPHEVYQGDINILAFVSQWNEFRLKSRQS